MSTILVHAGTATPVPLPFHTIDPTTGNSLKIKDFTDPGLGQPKGLLWSYVGNSTWRMLEPDELGLELITEAEFMERQNG